jgi:hypothetical protein
MFITASRHHHIIVHVGRTRIGESHRASLLWQLVPTEEARIEIGYSLPTKKKFILLDQAREFLIRVNETRARVDENTVREQNKTQRHMRCMEGTRPYWEFRPKRQEKDSILRTTDTAETSMPQLSYTCTQQQLQQALKSHQWPLAYLHHAAESCIEVSESTGWASSHKRKPGFGPW